MTDGLDRARAPHAQRADRIVRDRFEDVAAHARGDRPGGFIAAVQRLQDLRYSLLGPHGEGAIGDAREAFYRDSWRLSPFDPAIHDPALIEPIDEGAKAARTAPINGRDASRNLALLIDLARQHLAVAAHGPPETRAATIETWRNRHEPAIRAWAAREISDSQVSIAAVVGYLRLKEQYRDGD